LEGAKTSLCIQDINDDQIPDMIIGNYCGGLSYFIGDTLTTNINESYSFNNFLTYPNPTKEELFVQSKINGEIKIYSVLGVLMLQEEKITVNHRLNVNKLPAGIYILRLKNTSKKFVKE
jgi:hypothetical protein